MDGSPIEAATALPRGCRRIPPRWWPLILAGTVAAAALVWIWAVEDYMRQAKHIHTVMVGGGFGLGVLAWIALFSGWRCRTRLSLLGVVVVLGAAGGMALDIRGVDGDLIPILGWRWVPAPDRRLARPQIAPASAFPTLDGLRDYPQFLGPFRNATIGRIQLIGDLSSRPPRLLWRGPIGAGFSGFAVVGNHAVTQEQRGPDEIVLSYDLVSGKVRWTHSDRARYEVTLAGIGPRATPTISGSRVFAVGATGILNCLELATGRLLWSKNILEDNRAALNEWGFSGSPLIVDQMVVLSAGGTDDRSLVAYDVHDGRLIWAVGSDKASYSSPLLAELAGRRQILILNHTRLCAHDPATGQVLWEFPWPGPHPKVAQPVVLPGARLLLSSGYGVGCALVQIETHQEGLLARELWSSLNLKAKFTNLVHHEGYIYGMDDGVLACLEVDTGRRCWKRGRYGHGQLILADDVLLIQAESGQVILVAAYPERHQELGRFEALEGRTWNNPALAGRLLLVRNDREAACYEMPVAP